MSDLKPFPHPARVIGLMLLDFLKCGVFFAIMGITMYEAGTHFDYVVKLFLVLVAIIAVGLAGAYLYDKLNDWYWDAWTRLRYKDAWTRLRYKDAWTRLRYKDEKK